MKYMGCKMEKAHFNVENRSYPQSPQYPQKSH